MPIPPRLGVAVRVLLWEPLLLGLLGVAAAAVVSAMTAGALDSANIRVPLSVQLFLLSDALELSAWPGALGGAALLILLFAGAAAHCRGECVERR